MSVTPESLVPVPDKLKEAAMLARATAAVIASGDWLTVQEIARLAGFNIRNAQALLRQWKQDKAIFAIRHNDVEYFPSYGLDASAGYSPLQTMTKVIQILSDMKDEWGLAYWFRSVNSLLDGARPQDLLATEPERVVAAAKDELEAVSHG